MALFTPQQRRSRKCSAGLYQGSASSLARRGCELPRTTGLSRCSAWRASNTSLEKLVVINAPHLEDPADAGLRERLPGFAHALRREHAARGTEWASPQPGAPAAPRLGGHRGIDRPAARPVSRSWVEARPGRHCVQPRSPRPLLGRPAAPRPHKNRARGLPCLS